MDDFKREVFAKYKYIPPAALATGTADVSSTKVAFSNGATGHKNTPKPWHEDTAAETESDEYEEDEEY